MEPFEIRWKNFRSFEDTGWLRIRPLTIVIGANASGKTSLLAPLLMLKQSLDSRDPTLPLKTMGEFVNAGSYKDLIFRHETSRDLCFSLRDHRHEPGPNEKLKPMGEYPPGEIEITFSCKPGAAAPILKRYIIRDTYGRPIFSRSRLKSGRYSIGGPRLGSIDKRMRKTMDNWRPERFLFTVERVLRDFLEARRKAAEKKGTLTIQIPIHLPAVSYIASWLRDLLTAIIYIGPLREYPSRLYEVSGENPASVGTRGQFAPEVIFRQRDPELLRLVNKWVRRFEFGFFIHCKPVNQGAFSIMLRRARKMPPVNLADTGFGLSQVLPLIVQGFYAARGSLIIAEQPEIHLNPRLQALLADLFCEIAGKGRNVLVETHSEHLILRLRRLLAERKIKVGEVALYYVEKSQDRSTIREIPIEENGHIKIEDWPRGFFEDSLRESLGLATAQTKLGSHAK